VSFTVGIEEELLLVTPDGSGLRDDAPEVVAAMGAEPSAAGPEAHAAVVELRSPPSERAEDAASALAACRRSAVDAGATLMGVGLHPTAPWGDAALNGGERYASVGETMRGLITRTPECALHVHVGMPGPEEAIVACNGLREHLPLLIALAGNSPWWDGTDSGLASARWAVVRSYPRRGVPRVFRDRADYDETVAAFLAAGDLDDPTFAWWDIRPHPVLGTVEVREMDVQSSLGATAGIAALVRGLARAAVERPAAEHQPPEAIAESCFRAARDGVGARLLHDGALRPVAEIAAAAMALAGDDPALEGIERILAEGNGADRRRAAHAGAGTEGMLADLVAETAATFER